MAEPRIHVFDLTTLLTGAFYCAGCAERVCAATSGLAGVSDAACDIEGGTLEVTHDPKALPPGELDAQVKRFALEVSDSVGHASYRLTGLD
jgi:hypothetical protein